MYLEQRDAPPSLDERYSVGDPYSLGLNSNDLVEAFDDASDHWSMIAGGINNTRAVALD